VRGLLLCTLLLVPIVSAQQPATPPPAGSNWQRVHAIPVGYSVYVKTAAHKVHCAYQSSDAETFTCSKSAKPVTFQRSEVQSIKLGHRGRSAAIGAAPGGALLIGGLIAYNTRSCQHQLLCGLGSGLLAVGGGILAGVGAGVGAGTDFARSTVYVAP
jgi:hypothetical protein